ncbi:MAG: substrate-binding domain-containing protein [Microcoleaceae cyanobacterium]
MKLSHFSQTAVMSFALVLGLAAVPKLQVTAFTSQLVLAQTNSEFELPQTVAEGTEVRIDGSSSMEVTNTGLKQDFEAQYPQTAVTTNYSGSDAALEALKQGDIDLAAVGRGLTDSEKAEGFSESNVGRSKIAIIVGPDSPFQGSLTTEQFAQIFRGEITNWEEVGGPSAPIQLIDRPESSDTRRAFQNYPVFQSAPFQAGDSAVQVENETEAVIAQLGTEGIGYAIVNQVENQPGARIVPMHQVLPDVPEYPFSQPLAYVYRGAEPSEPGKAFLGYATTPEAERQVVATATPEEAATTEATETETTETETAATTETETTEPETAATTGTETIETAENLPEEAETSVAQSAQGSVATEARGGGFPWWLLLLPLLAIPLLLFRRKGEAETVAAPATRPTPAAPPPVVPQQESRVILTPRDCRDA